ncbi:hypothetical protein AMS68_006234 [Peltaster fructicola]|uniref:NmrA-like domain-containing protein n=1 Tax=Peltaster fructicola TaxID=286661 RepID=A0A6H0Y130_9PEZI|nr:hypothetical protein AMS68_006234 [Peltaster fructicola]
MAATANTNHAGGLQKIVLLGADGVLGPFLLHQLVVNNFEVTILKRAGSKSPDTYPSGVKVQRVSDSFPEDDIVPILKGHDAVITAINATQLDLQKRMADASVRAGIKRFMPADFGSCDPATQRAQDMVPGFKCKAEMRAYLTDLANKHSGFTWTSLVNGHLFDWLDFVKVFVDSKKISVLDSGKVKSSYSTRDRVGEATVHVLQRPAKTANKVLFVQSFHVDQSQIVAAFEKATDSTWTVERLESSKYEHEEEVKRDQGDDSAIENLVWLLGVVEGDWPSKKEFAMDLLELKDQDLDQVVGQIVKQHHAH